MIEESLDSAADTLWTRLGPGAVGAFERAEGMTSTVPATDGVWGSTHDDSTRPAGHDPDPGRAQRVA